MVTRLELGHVDPEREVGLAGLRDPKYLGELERGWHAATLPTAKRIADALDVPLSQLVRDL
jgi:hypothetical protein